MAKHLAKKAACLIGSAAVALSMTLGAFPVYADSAASAPELGPVTSKDVVYQIITDRFYDGDTSNNVPAGFDATLYDGTGQDLKLYQGGDWAGIIEKIPYLKGMGVTAVWISAPYENRDTEIIDYQSDGSLNRWTSFHGYHVRNYFATNKHFGTLNEFKELRDALHANGIKLVIDFVTNHTSREMNPTANNIPEDGKLYEPDRKEDGTFAFNENGEPYDYNGDGLVENLIADPQNDTNGWFHGLGDRGDDSSRYGYRYKDLGSLADFSQENQDVAAYLEQAKLIVCGVLSIIFGLICSLFTIIAEMIVGFPGFEISLALKATLQITAVNFFLYLAVLPIIALTCRKAGSFLVGVIIAFVYGYGGMFAAGNMTLANLYPITASLGMVGYRSYDTAVNWNIGTCSCSLVLAVVISAILILCMKEREATQTKKKAKKVAPKKGW